MNSIRTTNGQLVPVRLPDQPNQWSYKGFFITDIFSSKGGMCGRCSRSITYNYMVEHPVHGTSQVGMECIREVLEDQAIKSAMMEFHAASSKISQHRYRNRINRIRQRIPRGFMEVLKVETKKGSVLVKQALDHLEDKLKLRIFLSSYEVEILQRIEERV